MFISLIIATVNRPGELVRFLNSLRPIDSIAFEVIIVDQSVGDNITERLTDFTGLFPIKHIRLSRQNASYARNIGVQYAQGLWVAFPDDDCWYAPDTLTTLFEASSHLPNHTSIVLGVVREPSGKPLGRFLRKQSYVSLYTLLGKVNEPGVFIKREKFIVLNGFNEKLGPGGKYPSSEAFELIVRALLARQRVYFTARIGVYHPDGRNSYGEDVLDKGRRYSYGMGSVLAKYAGLWPLYHLWIHAFRFAIKLMLHQKARKQYDIQCRRGLLEGFSQKSISWDTYTAPVNQVLTE